MKLRLLHGVVWAMAWAPLLARPSAAAEPAFPHFELRIYSVTSNKLDAVLERFRDTVEPVRREHGITTTGCWTAATTNGDRFIYLLAAASQEELEGQEKAFGADPKFRSGFGASHRKHGRTVDAITSLPMRREPEMRLDLASAPLARAFDLRIYSVLPGKLDAFRDRWRDHAVPIYRDHGLHSLGWWIANRKDAAGNDQFVCLLAAESPPAIQKAIAAFHADPRWQRVEKETERQGRLRTAVQAFRMTPTDFSALK